MLTMPTLAAGEAGLAACAIARLEKSGLSARLSAMSWIFRVPNMDHLLLRFNCTDSSCALVQATLRQQHSSSIPQCTFGEGAAGGLLAAPAGLAAGAATGD